MKLLTIFLLTNLIVPAYAQPVFSEQLEKEVSGVNLNEIHNLVGILREPYATISYLPIYMGIADVGIKVPTNAVDGLVSTLHSITAMLRGVKGFLWVFGPTLEDVKKKIMNRIAELRRLY